MKKIKFGRYPQGESGEVGDIEWDVLEEYSDSYLLISSKCIDVQKYHNTREDVEWAECDLRRWLNNEFYNTAFKLSERAKLLAVRNRNTRTAGFFLKPYVAEETTDKVFLLSVEDIGRFYHVDIHQQGEIPELQAPITKYAAKRGADFDVIKGRGMWWLRTADRPFGALCIGFLGVLLISGRYVNNEDCSVRPVICLKK